MQFSELTLDPLKRIQDMLRFSIPLQGFRIPFNGFRIPGAAFQSLSVELAFWIPNLNGIPYSLSYILDFKAQDSWFYSPNFPDFGIRNPDSVTWGAFYPEKRFCLLLTVYILVTFMKLMKRMGLCFVLFRIPESEIITSKIKHRHNEPNSFIATSWPAGISWPPRRRIPESLSFCNKEPTRRTRWRASTLRVRTYGSLQARRYEFALSSIFIVIIFLTTYFVKCRRTQQCLNS